MPRLSATKRLERLKAQKQALEAEMQQIEKEQREELRKDKHRKYALIGRAVLEAIEKGEEVTLPSEADLLAFLDTRLARKTDRDLFGLVSEKKKGA